MIRRIFLKTCILLSLFPKFKKEKKNLTFYDSDGTIIYQGKIDIRIKGNILNTMKIVNNWDHWND